MSNSISRRTFLKCTGASVAALGAASLLGGCQQNGSATIVDVKVGDKVSNWNGLGVQLTSLFNIDTAPAQAGYEYIAVLVTVATRFFAMTPHQEPDLQHRRTESGRDQRCLSRAPAGERGCKLPRTGSSFYRFLCFLRRPERGVRCQHLAVQLQLSDLLGFHQSAPAGYRLSAADADGPQGLAAAERYLHAHLCSR